MEGGTDARDPLGYSGNPGHGTKTGSVLVSEGGFDANGGTTAPGRIDGLAPRATLVPIRTFNSVIRVLDSNTARAVRHATTAQCDVISMSLGGRAFFGLERAINDAVRRDIIVVNAAGNCIGMVVAPASYDNAIAVGATNVDNKPWKGSSKGRAVDISAPGEDVYVARRRGRRDRHRVQPGNGTSFATAAVAGAAAELDRVPRPRAHQGRARQPDPARPVRAGDAGQRARAAGLGRAAVMAPASSISKNCCASHWARARTQLRAPPQRTTPSTCWRARWTASRPRCARDCSACSASPPTWMRN